jgi:hypothetical protein
VRVKKTIIEANQDIVSEYLNEHQDAPKSMREIAAWAIRTGRWEPQRRDLISRCAAELSEAARADFYVDPQGRSVRRKHVVRLTGSDGKPQYLWADIEDAAPSHMRLSFSQRRGGILGDCKQLKADQDSYNDNNKRGAHLETLDFDFNADIDEMDRPTEYPESPPDES